MNISKALIVVALICFVLATFGVSLGAFASLQLVALGLAFYSASSLVG